MKFVHEEDRVWDSVLELLSRKGIVEKFYQCTEEKLKSLERHNLGYCQEDMVKIFSFTRAGQMVERAQHIQNMGEERQICLMYFLSRSMRCWMETGLSSDSSAWQRWPIANA